MIGAAGPGHALDAVLVVCGALRLVGLHLGGGGGKPPRCRGGGDRERLGAPGIRKASTEDWLCGYAMTLHGEALAVAGGTARSATVGKEPRECALALSLRSWIGKAGLLLDAARRCSTLAGAGISSAAPCRNSSEETEICESRSGCSVAMSGGLSGWVGATSPGRAWQT